jgi:hypothetical protein
MKGKTAWMHRNLGPGYLFSSILSIESASTTYMNPLDMFRCEINAFMNYASILSIKCASTTYMNPFDMLRCEINAFMNYAPFS